MHLYLSNHSPLNSVYTNEHGQAIYKVETPKAFGTRTSTISRIVPNDIQNSNSEDMRDRFMFVAQVVHKPIKSSILRFRGSEFETSSYFHKEGLGVYGRHRAFMAPNGLEYKWLLGAFTPELVAKDRAKTPIARFHRPSLGIFGKAKPASLEIFLAGEDIVETIVITFIYIEKLRRDKERSRRHSSGGGP